MRQRGIKRPSSGKTKLSALAFNDAVRDILRVDGVFKMSDDESREHIWEFDGLEWKSVAIDDHVEHRVEELVAFDLDANGDEAVASAS